MYAVGKKSHSLPSREFIDSAGSEESVVHNNANVYRVSTNSTMPVEPDWNESQDGNKSFSTKFWFMSFMAAPHMAH